MNFARTKGIEGTDAAALAKLRALSAAEIVRRRCGAGRGERATYSGRRRFSTAGWSRRRPRAPTRPGARRGFR